MEDEGKNIDRTPPHLEDYDEDGREDYFRDMRRNEREIRKKFLKLIDQIFDSLEKSEAVTFPRLKRFCIEYFKTIEGRDIDELSSKFDKVDNISDIHLVVTKYFSFYNFDFIEELVDTLGGNNDKKKFEDYEEDFKHFCIKVYNNRVVCGPYIPGRARITFKLNYDEDIITGETMERVKERISSTLGVRKSNLYLRQIKEGCLELDFLVPEAVCKRVCNLTSKVRQQMYNDDNIELIEVYNHPGEEKMVNCFMVYPVITKVNFWCIILIDGAQ